MYGLEIGTAPLPGLAPYDVAVDEASHTAFVSLWGGMKQGSGYIDGVVPVDVAIRWRRVAAAEPIATARPPRPSSCWPGALRGQTPR